MQSLFIRDGTQIGTVKSPKGELLVLEDSGGGVYLSLESLDSKTVVEVTDDDMQGILRLVCKLWSE